MVFAAAKRRLAGKGSWHAAAAKGASGSARSAYSVSKLARLTRRAEFLRAAGRGRRWAAPGLVLQAFKREPDQVADRHTPAAQVRYGLTASKKVGSAVQRNRARRRLRALAEEILPCEGLPGTDYVLIARAATVERAYSDLRADLYQALSRVSRPRRHPRDAEGKAAGKGVSSGT